MKKPMKLLHNLLLGTFSMALWFGVNSQTVKAETNTSIMPYEITVDAENQKLIINEKSYPKDVEIYYEYGVRKSVTSGKGRDKYSRDVCNFYSSASVDYKDGVVIDLSTLKREKDCYIRLYGNYYTEPITVKIPAINKAVTAEFNSVKATVNMYDKTDKYNKEQIITDSMEYRTVYGNWEEYEYHEEYDYYSNLSKYQQRGATLYFRLKAEAARALASTDLVYNDVEDAEGEAINVYEAFCFPGKEVKVTISKLPSAPKVAVNYDKQTFVLPKGTEYRVVSKNSDMKWMSAKKSMSVQMGIADLAEKYGKTDDMTLEVRSPETESSPASKINRISFLTPDMPTVKSVKNDTSTAVSKRSIDDSCLKDEHGMNALTAEYMYNEKKKQYTGVCFTNDLTDAYEICVVSASTVPSPSNTGIQTIKARPESKIPPAQTKISISKMKEGRVVYIRQKANSKKKQFSSSWTVFGVVSYPED